MLFANDTGCQAGCDAPAYHSQATTSPPWIAPDAPTSPADLACGRQPSSPERTTPSATARTGLTPPPTSTTANPRNTFHRTIPPQPRRRRPNPIDPSSQKAAPPRRPNRKHRGPSGLAEQTRHDWLGGCGAYLEPVCDNGVTPTARVRVWRRPRFAVRPRTPVQVTASAGVNARSGGRGSAATLGPGRGQRGPAGRTPMGCAAASGHHR